MQQELRMRRRAARAALPLVAADAPAPSEDLDLRVGVREAPAALPPGQRQGGGRALGGRLRVARAGRHAGRAGVDHPWPIVSGAPSPAPGAGRIRIREQGVEHEFRRGRRAGLRGPPFRALHGRAADAAPPVRRLPAAGEREDVCLLVPVTDEDAAAIEGAGGELLGELLRFGGVELDQATLEPLAAGAWSGAPCLRRGDEQRRLAARPGEAIAAAFGLQRPLRIRHAAWLAESVDPRDHAAQRARHLAARRWLEARVAARPRQAAASRVVVTVALEPAQRAAIDTALDTARTGLGADTALLMHAAAGLVAWRGEGERELGERYAHARAAGHADLADLLMDKVFPSDAIDGGVMFADIARHWRLEIGLVGARAIEDPDGTSRCCARRSGGCPPCCGDRDQADRSATAVRPGRQAAARRLTRHVACRARRQWAD
jgi:hypothetical protein